MGSQLEDRCGRRVQNSKKHLQSGAALAHRFESMDIEAREQRIGKVIARQTGITLTELNAGNTEGSPPEAALVPEAQLVFLEPSAWSPRLCGQHAVIPIASSATPAIQSYPNSSKPHCRCAPVQQSLLAGQTALNEPAASASTRLAHSSQIISVVDG